MGCDANVSPSAAQDSVLSVVVWKWANPGYRSTFTGEHVNALARMISKHYARPHKILCVTNDATGIDPAITIIPDTADFADVQNPYGPHAPSCYRRLRLFHPDAAQWFGERFVSLDLDMVAVRDLVPLWDRPEDVVLYRDPLYPSQVNGSMLLLTAGARPDVWTSFNPDRSPQIARGAGFRGSDQAWLSLRLPGEAKWDTRDGVYSYRKDIEPEGGRLPGDARLVVMHGKTDPWSRAAQALPWCRENWGEAHPSRASGAAGV